MTDTRQEGPASGQRSQACPRQYLQHQLPGASSAPYPIELDFLTHGFDLPSHTG